MNISSSNPSSYKYEDYRETADWLLSHTEQRPKIAIICGSCLGGLADLLDNKTVFPYKDIPHFPNSTVQGHVSQLVFGELQGKQCVCMRGRFHFYEGYDIAMVTYPVRVFFLLGVETLIITNAAGGLNPNFKVGDIMLIKDHINMPGFAGPNPLCGHNNKGLESVFPALWTPMTKTFLVWAKKLLRSRVVPPSPAGVVWMVKGPTFENITNAKVLQN